MGDVLFLDANVLFSAAWTGDSGLQRFWRLEGIRLVTSTYALDEATRNLETDEQRARLDVLIERVEVMVADSTTQLLFVDVDLPEKDVPILQAAVECKATHLITGDKRHFGSLWGRTVAGVAVCSPAQYLQSRR